MKPSDRLRTVQSSAELHEAADLLDEAERLAEAVVERSIATTDVMWLDDEQLDQLARAFLTKLRGE